MQKIVTQRELAKIMTQKIVQDVRNDALSFTDAAEIASQASRAAGRPNNYNYTEREEIIDQLAAWGI